MNKENRFDVIVAGTGSMGMPACYFFAKNSVRVLGLDQFPVPHDKGGHNGESRIVRKAYFEDIGYVPLLERAYELWYELEKLRKEKLFYRTGLVYFSNPKHPLYNGVKASANRFKIPIEEFDVTHDHEQFRFPDGYKGLFEPEAGFVVPEEIIARYKSLAIENGAILNENEKLISWKKQQGEFEIITSRNKYYSKKLILTLGPWINKTFSELKNRIRVTRQVIAWTRPSNPANYGVGNFPCWMIADDKPGVLYGFPLINGELKFAWHYPDSETDPDNVNRQVSENEIKYLQERLENYIPGAGKIVRTSTCLYDNSSDENFMIGSLPSDDNLIIATGFSGHGFKFAPVMGEILSDLAMERQINFDIEFLKINREEKFADSSLNPGELGSS